MLAVLKNRNYFWLWVGQTISLLGDAIRDFAMVNWIFSVTGANPVVQSLSFIAVMAPTLFLAPVAGVLVDRWDRRKAMIYSDLVRGVLSIALITAVIAGEYWYVLGLTFLASCCAQFFDPARAALLPQILPEEQRIQASSLSQSTRQIIQLAGPGIGTAVYVGLGARAAFIVDAASFFLSGAAIAMVAAAGAAAAAQRRPAFLAELKEGVSYCFKTPTIRALMIAISVLFMGAGAINSLGIFLVRQVLNLSEAAYAANSTVMPAATLATALLVGSAARTVRRPAMLVPLGLVLATVGIGLTAAAPNLAVLMIGSAIVGVCNAVLGIGMNTTIMKLVPNDLMGRVVSTMSALPTAVILASAGAAGVLAQSINPRYILGGGAFFIGLAALVAYAGLRQIEPETPATLPAVGG